MMIKGVIFDMDGTMFDTEPISAACWIKAGEKLGFPITADMVRTFCGKTIPAIGKMLRDNFGEETDYLEIVNTRQEYYDQMIRENEVPHKKGLVSLLQYLKEAGIPAAVSTSTDRKTAEVVIKKAGVYEYFTDFVYGDMVEKSKPNPDIFWRAAERIGQCPQECLVVEDSPAGVMAGKASGSYTILIPDVAHVSDEIKSGISAELNNLEEVIDWIREKKQNVITK